MASDFGLNATMRLLLLKVYSLLFYVNFGIFLRRTPTMIYVRESHVEKMGKMQDVCYEILNVLEFNRWAYVLTCISSFLCCWLPELK